MKKKQWCRRIRTQKRPPRVGIDPTTFRLTAERATNYAIEAIKKIFNAVSKVSFDHWKSRLQKMIRKPEVICLFFQAFSSNNTTKRKEAVNSSNGIVFGPKL